jgi:catechol 2,3-dioxygenase-like lactoylglutathione lyase family enzyme
LTIINVTVTLQIDEYQFKENSMNRIQLALNVSDLDEAVDFYTKFFRTQPAKVRLGYANFAIDDPPLKLVLIENGGEPGAINHLGVEVFSKDAVVESAKYLSESGLTTDVEDETTCCYAVQDKVWVDGPDKSRWEVYTVLSDANGPDALSGDGLCCTSVSATDTTNVHESANCC